MLVEAGAKVMLVDLNAEAVEAKARELGDNARFAVADISDEQAAKAAVDAPSAPSAACTGWSTAPASSVPRKCWARTARTPWAASPRSSTST
jgi:NAD(P)-dependent dehydrogenase (short-subunit alcohol dehydrogenase family)